MPRRSPYTRFVSEVRVSGIKRTRAEQRAHYRGLLIAAMARLLESESYTDVTIDQILAESGVARATFYANFVDKSELLMAVASEIYTLAIDVANPWWNLPSAASRTDLTHALARIVDLYLPNKSILDALMQAAAYQPPIRQRLTLLQQGSITRLAQHISAGQRAGTIRRDILPKETAGWLIWMIERGLYQMATSASPSGLRRLTESLTDIIWRTLYDR
jgi:AcrR family transcriptional regulator